MLNIKHILHVLIIKQLVQGNANRMLPEELLGKTCGAQNSADVCILYL